MLKLPRTIEADPCHEALVAVLSRDARPLWERGTLPVAHVAFDAPFEAALRALLGQRKLERGLEHITSVLGREQKGLDALRARQGSPPADRASRLLVMADEGSERFYRQCEALLLRHADRVLGLRVAAPVSRFSRVIGPSALVKVVLVTDRDGVVAALRALAG